MEGLLTQAGNAIKSFNNNLASEYSSNIALKAEIADIINNKPISKLINIGNRIIDKFKTLSNSIENKLTIKRIDSKIVFNKNHSYAPDKASINASDDYNNVSDVSLFNFYRKPTIQRLFSNKSGSEFMKCFEDLKGRMSGYLDLEKHLLNGYLKTDEKRLEKPLKGDHRRATGIIKENTIKNDYRNKHLTDEASNEDLLKSEPKIGGLWTNCLNYLTGKNCFFDINKIKNDFFILYEIEKKTIKNIMNDLFNFRDIKNSTTETLESLKNFRSDCLNQPISNIKLSIKDIRRSNIEKVYIKNQKKTIKCSYEITILTEGNDKDNIKVTYELNYGCIIEFCKEEGIWKTNSFSYSKL